LTLGAAVAILSKAIRIVGSFVLVLIVGIVGLILIFDPPPLRLQDETKFCFICPATEAGKRSRLARNGHCLRRKLEGYTGSLTGRPQITLFDWLRHQNGKQPEPDYHFYGTKTNDTWAFKIDRATKTVCYQKPSDVEAGITNPYCGLAITFENADRIIAVDDRPFDGVSTALLNKNTFTITMTGINVLEQLGANIEYFQCH
jgi:hypothetical protein